MTKRVLAAIAEVLPDDGHNYLTKLEIRHGWGDILNVQLHTTMPRSETGRQFGDQLRDAIGNALGDERHHVEIVWGAGG
jgi:hypothetical protein